MKEIKESDITLEASLLNALRVKKDFERFYNTIDKKRLIPLTSDLLKDYERYFEKYNEDIDLAVFYNEYTQNWHKDVEPMFLTYLRETVFPLIEQSAPKENLYISLLEKEASHKVTELVTKGDLSGIEDVMSSLKNALSAYQKDHDDDVFALHDIDLNKIDASNGLPWFLNSLSAGLGPLMPGQFIVVSADSGAGKSAFCISQAVHILRHIHDRPEARPILYCTSEDTKEDLAGRMLSNLYKNKCVGGFEEIIEKADKVSKHFTENFRSELFIGMQIRSAADLFKIRQKIDKYKPCLIIIDMLDKLSASDAVTDLTKLYQDIRAIANDGYAVIGTSQSGNTSYQDRESGEYKHRKWLTDKDLANSKSGKQGAAYAMIMIGQDDDVPGVRYISTTKKKRGKHVNVTCQLKEEYSLYEELL